MHRPVATLALTLAGLVTLAAPARARVADDEPAKKELPATYLEADQRDDGHTDAAAWLIGSGIAAAVFIGVGGTVMTRRQRRSQADEASPTA